MENSGAKGVIPNTNSALKLGERAIINEVNVTRVGRWMSPDELAQMQNGGKVVQGGGGQTFISTNFEYIYDNKGNVTHQRFIEGGSITGTPNQRPPKVK